MGTNVVMPQLGESVVEGKISKWLKKPGDAVKLYEPILEVETDKVTTEVTAAGEGTLLKLYFDEGEVVQAETLIAFIGQPGETPPAGGKVDLHAAEPAHAAAAASVAPVAKPPAVTRVSPVVARIAAEHNVDVSLVPGTGEGGRVTKKDILAYVERGGTAKPVSPLPVGEERVRELAPWEQPGLGELFRPTEEVFGAAKPAPAPAPMPTPVPAPAPMPGEVVSLSSMRRSIAEHMVRSKHASPHVTTVFEIDMSRVVAHRNANKAAFERDGTNLTYTPYFVAASVAALKQHPMANSSWREDGILLHRTVNVGVAVSLGDEGLIVPVIKNADSMNLLGLARAVNDLADRARRKALKPDDVQGGTFTITNHGVSGSLFATPIINQPQCGILGVGMVQKRAVVVTQDGVDSIAIKPMCYISFTFDHRILDGALADYFAASLKLALENWT
ncbi:MAG TPA: dihydrolipoamide acetyltransferase family protein [Anaerolineae bacterium]|nr:dihydrolipoamide acetyltransferase family protein [Anaerolineae bacterium]